MYRTGLKAVQNPGRNFTRDRRRSDVADSPELEREQKRAIHNSIEHLHGPESVDLRGDELIVLAQVRNARPYVRSFVEHYLSMGARHLVFLDNGSTDGTVEALKGYADGVTVLRTTLPFRTHNVAMRQYLIERFGRRRWSLLVDMDELFDYPLSDVVGLGALLRYLNENRYTAVVAHMLDMFSEGPISRDASLLLPEHEPLREKYRFYDVSDVRWSGYDRASETNNVASNENIKILRGGIRKTFFENNALLIKHPLVFLDDELRPMDLSEHWVGNARIADFTGVLYHYKFTDRFYRDAQRAVEERNRSDHGTRRYGKYLQVLEKAPGFEIMRETSKELESVDQLIADGFVVVSGEYLSLARREGFGAGEEGSELEHRLAKRIERAAEANPLDKIAVQQEHQFSRSRERLDVPDTPELERVRRWLLRLDVERVHGRGEVHYEQDELVVLCLLRNARPYVRSFVEHYLSMGARHLVFLDNGSTDGTVEALKGYADGVTVLRTTLPFQRYQLLMRQYLIERFGRRRWSLLVDVDELFDYPLSDVVGLGALLRYLNENRYTAVVAHMLDMFPAEPLSEVAGDEEVPLKRLHRFYDLADINSFDYRDAEGVNNLVSNEDIEILQGGVQKRLFNLPLILIKHPLILYDEELIPVDLSEHWVGNARVADISGVLLHYKLSKSLYDIVRREVVEQRYVNRNGKYQKYLDVLDASPELLIRNDTSRELESVNDLIGTQFANISEEYVKFMRGELQGQEGYSRDVELHRLYELFSRAKEEARDQRRTVQGQQKQDIALRRQLGGVQKRNRWLKRRTQELEDQISAIQSSRMWRFATVLSLLKRAVRNRMG
jgi:glycosyltransferase involved in cell wall biosynthesis